MTTTPALSLTQRALLTLEDALNEGAPWVRVHAAEFLIPYGGGPTVRDVFQREQAVSGEEPRYRIGIWRVLSAATATLSEREDWRGRIQRVWLDFQAPDRLHAVESLAKLGGEQPPDVWAAVHRWAEEAPEADALFALWLLWQAGEDSAGERIVARLASENEVSRLRAAFILRRADRVSDEARRRLAQAAEAESTRAVALPQAYVVGGAYALVADPAQMPSWKAVLFRLAESGQVGPAYEALQCLATHGTTPDLERIVPLLTHPEGDIRAAAAWAVLEIERRTR